MAEPEHAVYFCTSDVGEWEDRLDGTYVCVGVHHDKPAYEKATSKRGKFEMFFNNGDLDLCGWWIVCGDSIVAWNPCVSPLPPTSGWHAPFNSDETSHRFHPKLRHLENVIYKMEADLAAQREKAAALREEAAALSIEAAAKRARLEEVLPPRRKSARHRAQLGFDEERHDKSVQTLPTIIDQPVTAPELLHDDRARSSRRLPNDQDGKHRGCENDQAHREIEANERLARVFLEKQQQLTKAIQEDIGNR